MLNLSNSEYHKNQDFISCSGLKELLKSPAHYKYYLEKEPEYKPVFALGTAVHTAILEPDKFDTEIAVAPECDKRTKAGKEEWKEFNESSKGKTVITHEQYTHVQGMKTAVYALSSAKSLLINEGTAEESFFTEYEGVKCKIRPDFHYQAFDDFEIIIDLKTTRDASPSGFSKACAQYSYDLQAAFYSRIFKQSTGINNTKFIFIAVESSPPYLPAVYELSESAMDNGIMKMTRALELFKEIQCLEVFPGYPDMINVINLPAWGIVKD